MRRHRGSADASARSQRRRLTATRRTWLQAAGAWAAASLAPEKVFAQAKSSGDLYVRPQMWGRCAEGADCTGHVQRAIDHAASSNRTVYLSGMEYLVDGLTVPSHARIVGDGPRKSVLKLRNGANKTVLKSVGWDIDIAGRRSTGAQGNVILQDLGINGNRANNTFGDGINLFGFRQRLKHIEVWDVAENGIRTEWTEGPSPGGMEGYYEDVRVDRTGLRSWRHNGPHDSYFAGIRCIDPSLKGERLSNGFEIGPRGNGRFFDLHCWNRQVGGGVASIALLVEAWGCEFVGCHIEGGATPIWIAGQGNQFKAGRAYAADGPHTVVITGNMTTFEGYIEGGGDHPRPQGVLLGTESESAYGCRVDVVDRGCQGGTINFVNSAGHNRVQATGHRGGSPLYLGTHHPTDDVLLVLGGEGGGVYRHRYPA